MSTIDMTQVAGLQAVDAEGNVIGTLSVNDLTELVANNLVKSTQNQVFAARSVSTMSEASTLAVSDEYENTLPIDANPASVRTLDSEGNPKQTAISALAQVVGGLLSQNKAYPFMARENVGSMDFNNITEPGVYHIYDPSGDNRPNGVQYALLVVFNDSEGYITQIAIHITSASIYVRSRNEANEWFEWRNL